MHITFQSSAVPYRFLAVRFLFYTLGLILFYIVCSATRCSAPGRELRVTITRWVVNLITEEAFRAVAEDVPRVVMVIWPRVPNRDAGI